MIWVLLSGGRIGLFAGLAALVALAVYIGQMHAQEVAWRAIAQERRELDEWERELLAVSESRGCPACLLRAEGEPEQ